MTVKRSKSTELRLQKKTARKKTTRRTAILTRTIQSVIKEYKQK